MKKTSSPASTASGDSAIATPLLSFPCTFPLKVLTLARPDLAATLVATAQCFDAAFTAQKMTMRPSRAGNYQAFTLEVHVTSQKSLDDLYRAFNTLDGVKMTL